MSDIFEQRKKELSHFLTKNKKGLVYLFLGLIIWIGYRIRTSNLGLLIDQATGKHIPIALDPFSFLRYAEIILETGKMVVMDTLRYYPYGFNPKAEFGFLSWIIVYLYKILHFFDSSITIQYADLLYPAIAFIFISIFFFLLVKELFKDERIALLATAFLAVVPPFLFRTTAGFGDKEALGTIFVFMTFYFFIKAWNSQGIKQALILAVLAGMASGFAGAAWGGVNLLWMTIGVFALIEILIDKFSNLRFVVYSFWLFFLVLSSSLFSRYTFSNLIGSLTSQIMFFTFGLFVVKFLINKYTPFKIKDKISGKIPLGLFSFFLMSVLGVLILLISYGPNWFISKISSQITYLTKPFGGSRWGLTVAEGKQPYVVDWIGQFSQLYFWLFFIASIILFYNLVKKLDKYKYLLTGIYSAFVFSFVFSRYSPGSPTLNGVSSVSLFMFVGSVLIFGLFLLGFFWWCYLKDREAFEIIKTLHASTIFVFVFYMILLIAARSAIRLLYIFAPITAILVAYLVVVSYDSTKKLKFNYLRYFCIALIFFVIFSPFGAIISGIPILGKIPLLNTDGILFAHYKVSSSMAANTGPSYHLQWQNAMNWVKQTVPENAVFSHWWDYGYWVQYGGRRATLSDGGNSAGGAINYYTARYLLTNPDISSTLDFLYSNDVSHVLIVGDDIGKYGAYSSIGSDENYDRYSWITVFNLDQSKMQQTREEIGLYYSGSFAIDEDLILPGKVFPRGRAAVVGVVVPFESESFKAGDISNIKQPTAVVGSNNELIGLPMSCLVLNGKRYDFDTFAIDACALIVPYLQDSSQGNVLGSLIFLSKRVKDSMFARLYLYGENIDSFELVYSDGDKGAPLINLRGNIVGPIKIWKMKYPSGLEVKKEYRERILDNPEVYDVKEEYY